VPLCVSLLLKRTNVEFTIPQKWNWCTPNLGEHFYRLLSSNPRAVIAYEGVMLLVFVSVVLLVLKLFWKAGFGWWIICTPMLCIATVLPLLISQFIVHDMAKRIVGYIFCLTLSFLLIACRLDGTFMIASISDIYVFVILFVLQIFGLAWVLFHAHDFSPASAFAFLLCFAVPLFGFEVTLVHVAGVLGVVPGSSPTMDTSDVNWTAVFSPLFLAIVTGSFVCVYCTLRRRMPLCGFP